MDAGFIPFRLADVGFFFSESSTFSILMGKQVAGKLAKKKNNNKWNQEQLQVLHASRFNAKH